MIQIDIKTQILQHYHDDNLLAEYLISTAKNGVGEVEGSECTPLGQFKIAEKIGADLPIGSVLVARVPTGEIYSQDLAKQHPARDWILSRILWLEGCEDFNQNSKARLIYIHGTPDTEPMGVAQSHGCIRMCNTDIMVLFEAVCVGDDVIINE